MKDAESMSTFAKIYSKIKPSIVAIASKVSTNPEFPDIIGTGFIARADGIIFTNEHVIKAIQKLPRHKGMSPNDWPAIVLYFHYIPEKGNITVPLDIRGVVEIGIERKAESVDYGPDIPDLGIIHVHIKDMPTLIIADRLGLQAGDEVMLSGFPMGTDTLRAPGWMHQFTPTLQSGIISAILPFPCDNPHAILLNIMTQGGSSGSPVLNPSTGEVIGIEYAGIIEPKKLAGKGILIYKNNTSLTLAIPAKIINKLFHEIDKVEEINKADFDRFDTIESLIAKKQVIIHKPRTATMLPISPGELLRKKSSRLTKNIDKPK